MKKVFCFLLFVFCQIALYAQDKEAEAKVHYILAEESFNKGTLLGADECIDELRSAEFSLGTTNPKILYLKIKAEYKFYPYLYNQHDLIMSLRAFFKLTDVNNFPADKYGEIVKISLGFSENVKDLDFEKKIRDSNFIKINKELAPDYQFTSDGYYSHGLSYYYKGRIEGYSEALHYFTMAADSGSVLAMSMLSQMYEHGEGGEENEERALYWAFKAYDSTKILLLNNFLSRITNAQKVIDWAIPIAESNNYLSRFASLLIAQIYYEGMGGVEKDNFQALQWYIKTYSQTKDSGKRMVILDRIGTIHYVNSKDKDQNRKTPISKLIDDWKKSENILKLY